jgi:flagellar basal-body rod protein FlgF
MIYGLYLSATGVLTNSYRQDVIANNLANAETVGFKRNLAMFQERRTEAQELGDPGLSDPRLERIGGGMVVSPTLIDHSQGNLEVSDNKLDLAIEGNGFFAVKSGNDMRLTRNGKLLIDRAGYLALADGSGHRLLDVNRNPIQLTGFDRSRLAVRSDGTITSNDEVVARLGLFDVPDKRLLTPHGGTLLSYPESRALRPASGTIQSGFIENSNVDPMTELAQLINCQRQLEANANMIRFQDQTLGKLVNEVGKIG